MGILREIWQRITRTNYTRDLEAEVVRQRAEIDHLRAENRALLNSILGIAGIPPIPIAHGRLIPQAPPTADSGAPSGPETLPSHSHSESARADDESSFRPPPPAKDSAGQKELSGPGITGLPGRRLVEPGRSAELARSDSMGGALPTGQSGRPRNDSRLSSPHMRPLATPLRRRSWHQINRMLEIESARKRVASD